MYNLLAIVPPEIWEESLSGITYSSEDLFMDITPALISILTSSVCTFICVKDKNGFIKFIVALCYFGIIGAIILAWQFLLQHKLIAWSISIVCIILYIIKCILDAKENKRAKRAFEKYHKNKNNQDPTH